MSAIDVCKIQEAQLNTARDKLVQAVGSIIEKLRDISNNIMEISQNTQELSNANTEEEHSFFEKMAGHLAEVSGGLHQYGLATDDLSLLMSSVAPAVADMSLCLRDIEGIEIAIERIALNACIKAAHLGEEGAVLGVLAEGMQRLVGDTRRQTVKVSAKLESIISTAQELSSRESSDARESGMEVSLLTKDIGTMMQSLRTLNENAHSSLNLVKEKGKLLSEDIKKSCDGINVHERAAGVIDSLVLRINQLRKQYQSQLILKDLETTSNIDIKILSNHYTMKAERMVHVSIASPYSPIASASDLFQDPSDGGSVIENEKDHEENLGDNVELF
jgi:hypothetical protein